MFVKKRSEKMLKEHALDNATVKEMPHILDATE